MMDQHRSSSRTPIDITGILGILFVGLKLGGIIDWSWWWVTLPFWAGAAIVLVVLLCLGLGALIAPLFEKERWKTKG